MTSPAYHQLEEPKPSKTCPVCGESRRPEKAGPYRAEAERDCFCSTECCQAFYGLHSTTIGEKKKGRKPDVYDAKAVKADKRRQRREDAEQAA